MLAKALHKEVLVETFILVETQTFVSVTSWVLVVPCLWPLKTQWRVVSWYLATRAVVAYSLNKVIMLIRLVWL